MILCVTAGGKVDTRIALRSCYNMQQTFLHSQRVFNSSFIFTNRGAVFSANICTLVKKTAVTMMQDTLRDRSLFHKWPVPNYRHYKRSKAGNRTYCLLARSRAIPAGVRNQCTVRYAPRYAQHTRGRFTVTSVLYNICKYKTFKRLQIATVMAECNTVNNVVYITF